MRTIRSNKSRVWLRLITFTVITALVCQNAGVFVSAGQRVCEIRRRGEYKLAPESRCIASRNDTGHELEKKYRLACLVKSIERDRPGVGEKLIAWDSIGEIIATHSELIPFIEEDADRIRFRRCLAELKKICDRLADGEEFGFNREVSELMERHHPIVRDALNKIKTLTKDVKLIANIYSFVYILGEDARRLLNNSYRTKIQVLDLLYCIITVYKGLLSFIRIRDDIKILETNLADLEKIRAELDMPDIDDYSIVNLSAEQKQNINRGLNSIVSISGYMEYLGKGYDQNAWNLFYGWYGPKILEAVTEVLELEENDAVLDVGSKEGTFLNLVADKIKRGINLDLSKEATRRARNKALVLGTEEKMEFVSGDVCRLNINRYEFNKVFAAFTLGHIKDRDQRREVLKKLIEGIKGKGKLVIYEQQDIHNVTVADCGELFHDLDIAGVENSQINIVHNVLYQNRPSHVSDREQTDEVGIPIHYMIVVNVDNSGKNDARALDDALVEDSVTSQTENAKAGPVTEKSTHTLALEEAV